MLATPFAERRAQLEAALAGAAPPVHLTPATTDRALAADWFSRFEGAGLDGVMAKPARGTYEPNKRVMLKVKHERDCDCVVAGFRWHKDSESTAVGSLLLGLYDDEGALQHVGVVRELHRRRSARAGRLPRAVPRERARDRTRGRNGRVTPGASTAQPQRMPGGKSRWSQGKDLSWEPLRPELVVEVAYDHMQGTRFRHTAQFRRWRTDKSPARLHLRAARGGRRRRS